MRRYDVIVSPVPDSKVVVQTTTNLAEAKRTAILARGVGLPAEIVCTRRIAF